METISKFSLITLTGVSLSWQTFFKIQFLRLILNCFLSSKTKRKGHILVLHLVFYFEDVSNILTKSRIFKNLDLRKEADRTFHSNLLKNHCRHVKLYSNLPSWLARSRCHMGTFWKTKDWISHFFVYQTFKFCCVGVHRLKRLKSTKTGISS